MTIEYAEIYYSDGAVAHPVGSPADSCYTNGIDATGGDDWVIRNSRIQRIRRQNGALAGPAILMQQGSTGTVIERNTILDSSRGISLGLVHAQDAASCATTSFAGPERRVSGGCRHLHGLAQFPACYTIRR